MCTQAGRHEYGFSHGNAVTQVDLRMGPAADTLDELIAAGQSETFDFAFLGEQISETHQAKPQ